MRSRFLRTPRSHPCAGSASTPPPWTTSTSPRLRPSVLVYAKMKAKGIRLVVAEVMDDVKTRTRYRFRELIGEDAHYERLEDVLNQYRQQFNVAAPSKQSDQTPGGVDRGA